MSIIFALRDEGERKLWRFSGYLAESSYQTRNSSNVISSVLKTKANSELGASGLRQYERSTDRLLSASLPMATPEDFRVAPASL